MKEKAWKWIEDNQTRIIEVSDAVWEYAELGLVEHKSAKLISDELKKHGFKIEMGVADIPTAFVAEWGSGRPVISVLGEYDALPGISQKPVPYKEPIIEGAPGHGCGHNIHGVSGMAGAIAARYALEKSNIPGSIKFFGSPAEESYEGKVFMVRSGLFDDIDASISHHTSSINTAGLGSSNAMNSVKFHFHGRTAHAAGDPQNGISSLDAVELMNTGVNYLREHIIEKARIHYVIEVGGSMPNVVPAYARSWYYVRAPERDQVDNIYSKVLDIAKGAAMMTGTTLEVEFLTGCYNKLPNRVLSDLVITNMREIGSPKYTDEELEFASKLGKTITKEQKREALRKREVPNWEKYMDIDLFQEVIDPWTEGKVFGGSSDVSDVSWNIPTMEFGTAAYVLGIPGHSWQVVACCGMSIGHKSLIFAAKTLAGATLDLITKPEILKKAQDEFKERMKGRIYKCPIPSDVQPPLEVARIAAEASKKRG